MKIVAFGTYQAHSHPRVQVLIDGLRSAGHDVVEINEPLGMTTADRVAMLQRPWTVVGLAGRLVSRWWRLARRARRECPVAPDAVLVGYMGHFDVHLARRVFPGSPIVLDHLIFAAGTALDRGARKGIVTRLLSVVDRRALSAADVIVLDTAEHQARVPASLVGRTVLVPVGADSTWFDAGRSAIAEPGPGEPVKVVFFGLYAPLHGAVTIGSALRMLAERGLGADDLTVTMIGTGQDLVATQDAAGPSAPATWRGWVDPAELPTVVAGHHVALGIFGTTAKAAHVVPTKLYQSAAAGCALITSDTAPQRRTMGAIAEFVPAGDAGALADILETLVKDRALLAMRRCQAREAAPGFAALTVIAPLVARLASMSTGAGTGRIGTATAPDAAPLSPRAALRWPLIHRMMRETRPATVLEVGCGQGAMGARLVAGTQEFLAVEPDGASFDVARRRIESRGGTVRNCLSDDLEPGRTFDLVCAFEVLEHIEDDAGALESWARRVRLGGHLMLSVPAWQHLFGRSDTAVGHFRRYSPDELHDKLRAAGFEPVRISLYGWPLVYLLEAVRNRLADGTPHLEDAVQGTALSGRWLQPTKKVSGMAISVGILPFRALQRMQPRRGNGIVCLARRVR